MEIKEVIVVEGKNDALRLKEFFDCETIITHGLALDDKTIEFIKEVNMERGVILFLDPDSPGEKIRKRLNEAIPNLKNAFVMKKDARTTKKVGVEHASKEVLMEALNNLLTYEVDEITFTNEDLVDLGLAGASDSSLKREYLSEVLHIGKCNAKQFLKRLNMLHKTKKEIMEIINEGYINNFKN